MKGPMIRVQRTSESFGSILSVRIYVDGEYAGDIPGPAPASKDFQLPGPGEYEICFEIQWCRSAPFRCRLSDDEYQNLRIELPPDPVLSSFYRRNNFGRLVPERQQPEKIR